MGHLEINGFQAIPGHVFEGGLKSESFDKFDKVFGIKSINLENNKTFLVDTSPDLRMQMIDANIKDVDAVLYTHSHADHVHGIDDLRAFCWQRKDNKPLPIYSDQYTIDQITRRFDYAFENKYGPAVPLSLIHI